MKPFLLITTRDDDSVALPERASYAAMTGLSERDLVWHRAERDALSGVDPREFSGIILAGSPFTVSVPVAEKSATERRVEAQLGELLDTVVDADVPFLGICYGVGTIGKHQGATVDHEYGESVQVARVRLTDRGREDPLFAGLPSEFAAYVGHKEAISRASAHMAVLASAPSCPVQAFRVGRNVYATQFHPELDAEALAERIRAYSGYGYFDDDDVPRLLEEIRSADVSASQSVLRRFVELYS